jgi:hypothetical protein
VYFPDDAYTPQDRRAQLIRELLGALGAEAGWQLLSSGMRAAQHLTACVIALDYEQLLQLCDSPNLAAALEMQPSEGLACLEAAVHEVIDESSDCICLQLCGTAHPPQCNSSIVALIPAELGTRSI